MAVFRLMTSSNLRRLLDWQIGGLGAFQDFIHVAGGSPVHVDGVGAIGHQPARFGDKPIVVTRRDPVLRR